MLAVRETDRTRAASRPDRENAWLSGFAAHVLAAVLILAGAYALWRLADVLLLLFGAVLIAIALRGLGGLLSRLCRLAEAVALGIVLLMVTVGFAAMFWFFGSVIADQFADIAGSLPAGVNSIAARLHAHPYGHQVIVHAQDVNLSQITGPLLAAIGVAMSALARAVGLGVIMFVTAVYLAAQPRLYRRLALGLVPPAQRAIAERLFDRAADTLRHWLLGQLVVMLTIGTLSGLGLWALGVEAAFALGLVGGLLTFIPYVGAVLAAVPAVLVALAHNGVESALWVVLMYVGAHFIEGNFITPLVQREATAMPPVLALLSTVAFSVLAGPSAVLLAAPLTLFLLVAIEVIYVEHTLGERGPLHGGCP